MSELAFKPIIAAEPAERRTEPLPKAGEIVLTPGQKIALLKMRRSDWSEAVLKTLERFGKADCAGTDYRTLAQLGLATCKGSYHVLTTTGRRRADEAALALARENDLHALTFNCHPAGNGAPYVRCTCGFVTYKSRFVRSFQSALYRAGQHHLRHVGAAS